MVELQVYGHGDAAYGYVVVVEGRVCDDCECEEDGRGDEEEDCAKIGSQQGWRRRYAEGKKDGVLGTGEHAWGMCAGLAAAERDCAAPSGGVLLLRSEEVTYLRESHP